jgi:hypothetical protein
MWRLVPLCRQNFEATKPIDFGHWESTASSAAGMNKGGRGGNPGGSLEATRRSFNKDFLLALAADFKQHGASAIEKVRKQQPAAYMKICALLVPKELKVETTGRIEQLTDEQLDAAIAFFEEMIERRAGEATKVIENEAEAVPSLPAPKPAS